MSLFSKLSKILPFKNPKNQEYFFALNIGQKKVEAAVWGISGHKLSIVNLTEEFYNSSEDLVEASNICLDKALLDFEPEPTKILFGVPPTWVLDDDLKENYSKLLKKLIHELDVQPLAYVSSTHAISHLLGQQQGIPVTTILVSLSDPLIITLIKAGKIVAEREIKRSNSLAEDIEKGLLNFTDVEVLPSKILLYSSLGEDVKEEKIKDELQSFSWMANLPFLHLPKIEILQNATSILSICLAGATEFNPSVHLSEKDISSIGIKFDSDLIGDDAHKRGMNTLHDIDEVDNLSHFDDSGDDFEKIGFVRGDIERLHQREQRAVTHHERKEIQEKHPYDSQEERLLPTKHFKIPKISFLIPILLLLILLGSYIYLPKAQVKIYVDPKILEKDAEVTVDPSITLVDEASKKIPGKIVEDTLTGSEKGVATGKKKIGDRAKGQVIIYNKTDSLKTLSAGTVLISSDNLKFDLDSTVNIASESAVEGGISFGKTSASVVAEDIGPESNLPAGKDLSIKGISSSDLNAKVDQAFSGGTSKDVTVVSSDDQKKLLETASLNLRKQAKDSLTSKVSGDLKVLEETLTEEITKQSFSKKINDQATEFTLSLTAHYKGTAYSDTDLKTMIGKLVETNIPEGFILNLSQTETQADVGKVEKDGRLIFVAKFRAKLLPKIDEEKTKRDIRGKTPQQAALILKNIDSVVSSDIVLKPTLPSFLVRLPILTKNITILVTTK